MVHATVGVSKKGTFAYDAPAKFFRAGHGLRQPRSVYGAMELHAAGSLLVENGEQLSFQKARNFGDVEDWGNATTDASRSGGWARRPGTGAARAMASLRRLWRPGRWQQPMHRAAVEKSQAARRPGTGAAMASTPETLATWKMQTWALLRKECSHTARQRSSSTLVMD